MGGGKGENKIRKGRASLSSFSYSEEGRGALPSLPIGKKGDRFYLASEREEARRRVITPWMSGSKQ